jgi:hypothetical protein
MKGQEMDTPEQPTCSRGLAENSALPARIGQLIAAMAENLEVHIKALDLTDPFSRAEYNAYEKLVKDLQESAVELQRTADEMVGYRDLAMRRHEQNAMTHPMVRQAFEKFVEHKQELLSLLKHATERDQQLLEMMRTNGR